MSSSSSANIKRVVVLMFENRSFDHILGDMPGVNGLFDLEKNLKPGIYNVPNPLEPADDDQNKAQNPFPIAPGLLEQTYIVDGDHDFDVMLADLAGPGTTGILNNVPQNNPTLTYPAVNPGFVYGNSEQSGGHNEFMIQYPVMSYFEWGSMQVFHELAAQFVVCDNWFCDMPAHTAPNRAFMHCATTGDLGIDDDYGATADNNQGTSDAANENYPVEAGAAMVNSESIFERLETYDQTWKMYIPGVLNEVNSNNLDTDFLNNTVANQYWTPGNPLPNNCTNVPLDQFCTDANAGNLSTYSFIMCWNHEFEDTSMHPSSPVEPAKNLLAGVYNTLRNSPCWEDTLLVVTFDENGGLYDHVRPPATVPPNPDAAPETTYETYNSNSYTFDYSMLGFRIPVILISPWLQAGIESQQLQNTSILRFLQDQFCATGLTPSYLTQRDQLAPSLQAAFNDFGLSTARLDCPVSIETYQDNSYPTGICLPPGEAQSEHLSKTPKPYMAKVTLDYLKGLPGHADSGQHTTRTFSTNTELMDYAVERKQAARAFYEGKI